MRIGAEALQSLVERMFMAAGCSTSESTCVAQHLVESNLVGHDSHGVIRAPTYINWLREGRVLANRTLGIEKDLGSIVTADGQLGLGQVMGRDAMRLAIERAAAHGLAVVALRNSGHLGRIGHFAEMAALEEKIAFCFVNSSGMGMLVAPFGGIDRRLSANPIAVGIPHGPGRPIVLDMSTCAIAEGKIRVAFNKGEAVPDNCIIDHDGRPTTDPKVFYGDPPGAILPIGGHKGFGLGVVVEILAGALTGNGCTRPGAQRLEQGLLLMVFDPAQMRPPAAVHNDVEQFLAFVRSSRTRSPDGVILMPGEPEQRTKTDRLARGIAIDVTTWHQLTDSCQSLGIDVANELKCVTSALND